MIVRAPVLEAGSACFESKSSGSSTYTEVAQVRRLSDHSSCAVLVSADPLIVVTVLSTTAR